MIVSRDAINRASPVVIVVPCTARKPGRKLYPSQILISCDDGGFTADSIALCEQVRAIAKDRLANRWGVLAPATMERIDRALLIAMDLPGQYW